jgi:hypothetical protein
MLRRRPQEKGKMNSVKADCVSIESLQNMFLRQWITELTYDQRDVLEQECMDVARQAIELIEKQEGVPILELSARLIAEKANNNPHEMARVQEWIEDNRGSSRTCSRQCRIKNG